MANFDCIVIGKGPAGISTAIYVVTAGNTCMVVGGEASALVRAESISNYYGIDGISGPELFRRGEAQARALGAVVVDGEVVAVTMTGEGFEVALASGERHGARSVVLACGVKRERARAKGLAEFDGRGVSYCAVCDGFLYRDSEVAVLGAGAYAKEEAEHLVRIGCKVTVFTGGDELDVPGARVIREEVAEVKGDRRVRSVVAGGVEYGVSCVFVAVGRAGAADFARTVGLMQDGEYVVVDKAMMTNCPGIFACGDAIGGFLQVSTAVGEGALAGRGVNQYLKNLNK